MAFTLGPLNFSANGGALIYSGGIALSLQVTASADADVFSISASGLLQINTGSQTELGIAGNSFQLQLTGTVSILKVLNFNASMDVIVAGGAWQFSTNATVDFFGIFTLNGSIFLDSAGDFSVSLSGGVDFGCCGFGISGGFFITITSTHDPQTGAYFFNASGGVSADLEAFGIDFGGVSFSFGVSVSSANGGSAPLILDTEASVHILFVHVHFHLHFTIGYIQLPPPVYMGGSDSTDDPNNVTAAETFNGGELYLNVGNLAPLRNIAGDSTNDTYLIKQIGGTAQSATIQVTAFGRTDTYQNVTGISGDWSSQQGCASQTDPSDGTTFNTCQDTIIVDPSVLVPLTLKGSPGDDVIEYEGNNDATQIWGEGGNNQIFATGPSAVTIYGDAPGVVSTGQNIINHSGTGAARITPGGGGDDITVDSPTDLVFAAAGNNIINGVAQEIDTGNGINTINLSPQGSPVIVDNTGGGQDTLNFTIPSGTATISGTGTATNDYTLVYAGPLASGTTTYTINGVETLVFTGSADTTAFDGFDATTADADSDDSGRLHHPGFDDRHHRHRRRLGGRPDDHRGHRRRAHRDVPDVCGWRRAHRERRRPHDRHGEHHLHRGRVDRLSHRRRDRAGRLHLAHERRGGQPQRGRPAHDQRLNRERRRGRGQPVRARRSHDQPGESAGAARKPGATARGGVGWRHGGQRLRRHHRRNADLAGGADNHQRIGELGGRRHHPHLERRDQPHRRRPVGRHRDLGHRPHGPDRRRGHGGRLVHGQRHRGDDLAHRHHRNALGQRRDGVRRRRLDQPRGPERLDDHRRRHDDRRHRDLG